MGISCCANIPEPGNRALFEKQSPSTLDTDVSISNPEEMIKN